MILFRIIATIGYGLSVTAPSACKTPATLNASSVPDLRMYRSFWTLTVAKSSICFSGQMRSSFTRAESCSKVAVMTGFVQSRITPTLKLPPLARVARGCYNLVTTNILSFLLRGNGVITVGQLAYSNWVNPPSFTGLFHPRTTRKRLLQLCCRGAPEDRLRCRIFRLLTVHVLEKFGCGSERDPIS